MHIYHKFNDSESNDTNDNLNGSHFIELKKTKPLQFDDFDFGKRCKYWLQSYLAGIRTVACAYEDVGRGGEIVDVKMFDVNNSESLIDFAAQKALLSTLGGMLRFIKESVSNEDHSDSDSASMWRLRVADGSGSCADYHSGTARLASKISLERVEERVPDFVRDLCRDYVDELYSL